VVAAAFQLAAAAMHAQATPTPNVPVPSVKTVGLDYSHVTFGSTLDPWDLASASLGSHTALGTLIGRVNYAHRFGTSGAQVEADAYPRLSSNTYAYVSVGYSGADIFPQWRSGAELFASLPQAWEASVGYRQLRFSGPPVTLITGSVGKYIGNGWLSLRPFIHTTANGTSASASLTGRRYFADGDHFVGGRVSYGSAPPDVGTDVAALTRVHSSSATVQGSGSLSGVLLGTWAITYESEELAFARIRKSWSFSTGIRVPF
jgi:YaiO family outer membrane protein